MSTIQKLESELRKERAKQKFVVFYSPGTFVSETNKEEIQEVNLKEICTKAAKIKQRHGAIPYGFCIEDGNSKILSGFYYLTGNILRYNDIPQNKNTEILKFNMKCNGYPIVIQNNNSYRFTNMFNEKDCIVDWDGYVLVKGDDRELMEYRTRQIKEWEKK